MSVSMIIAWVGYNRLVPSYLDRYVLSALSKVLLGAFQHLWQVSLHSRYRF